MRQKINTIAIILLAFTVLYSCKKDNNSVALPDYKNLIVGKWLWYKTITTTSSANPSGYDTFYNGKMFKEFLANGKVITTESNGQTYTENYFFLNDKLGQTNSSANDTGYSKIVTCTASAFSLYDKVTYNNVNPPAVVEYWHYFVK